MRVGLVLIAILIFVLGVVAQPDSQDLRSAQKELKKNLMKYAPQVSKVDFKGCQASIKVVWWKAWDTWSNTGGYVGGGFPTDEASSSFSAGTGMSRAVGADHSFTYEIDLARFDATGIAIEPILGRKMDRVILTRDASTDTVRISGMSLYGNAPIYAIASNARSGDKIVNAFKAVIDRCSGK